MLEIEVREAAAGITVVKFGGRMTMGPESAGVEVLVGDLLAANRKKVVFDLSGVEYIDSMGLGVLTFCSATMLAGGGALRVAGVQALPARLFQLTKLDKILSLFRTVEDASRDFTVPLLTEREQAVLKGVFEGLTNKEIASRVQISEALVKATLQQLFEKSGVRTRSQLVRVALQNSNQL
jgi:anti-anti-sigma factor